MFDARKTHPVRPTPFSVWESLRVLKGNLQQNNWRKDMKVGESIWSSPCSEWMNGTRRVSRVFRRRSGNITKVSQTRKTQVQQWGGGWWGHSPLQSVPIFSSSLAKGASWSLSRVDLVECQRKNMKERKKTVLCSSSQNSTALLEHTDLATWKSHEPV